MTTDNALVIAKFSNSAPWVFEFGEALDPDPSTESRLMRVLEEYDHRWEETTLLTGGARAKLLRLLGELPVGSTIFLNALDMLGYFGRPNGWEQVADFLGSDDPNTQLAAIHCLGRMGMPRSADKIRPFLGSTDPALRRAAVIAIGKLAREDLINELKAIPDPSLAPLVEQAEARTRATLSRSAPAVFRVVIGTDQYLDLIPLAFLAVQEIKDILKDRTQDQIVLAHTVDLAGLVRMESVATQFLNFLQDHSNGDELRRVSAAGLGRCKVKSARDVLTELLEHPDSPMRAAAITALGQIGDPLSFAPLLSKWNDEPLRRRTRLALRRVCRLADIHFAETFRAESARLERLILIDSKLELHEANVSGRITAWLDSTTPMERLHASFLLGFCGTRKEADRLLQVSKEDPDPAVREAAAAAYRMLAQKQN